MSYNRDLLTDQGSITRQAAEAALVVDDENGSVTAHCHRQQPIVTEFGIDRALERSLGVELDQHAVTMVGHENIPRWQGGNTDRLGQPHRGVGEDVEFLIDPRQHAVGAGLRDEQPVAIDQQEQDVIGDQQVLGDDLHTVTVGAGADETVLEALPDRLRVDGLDPGGLDTVEVNDEQLIVEPRASRAEDEVARRSQAGDQLGEGIA